MVFEKDRIKRLVVRGPNWIGDAVMCEPALVSLRRLFPSAEITLLAKPNISEVLRGSPGFDRVLAYEVAGRHAGLAGKWALANQLRRENFHLAVLFQNAFEAALLTLVAGIPHRYGYATDGRRLLLTQAIPAPARFKMSHQVQYYLDLLRPLGSVDGHQPPRLYLTNAEDQAAERHLSEAGVMPTDFLIGVNPGSIYGGAKRWLPERFAQTADRLVQTYQAQTGKSGRVVIVGAPGEEDLGQEIAAQMRHRAVVLTGRTTIRELMAVIKRCALFLTNDTGPMHIAAAFDVPLVAVFGPTDASTTGPCGDRHSLVRHAVQCAPCLLRECPIDHRCMTGVTVDMVYAASVDLLKADKLTSGQADRLHPKEAEPSVLKASQSVDLSACQPVSESTPLQGITVFFDRDGTLNRDTGYVKTPEELDLFPDVPEAVVRLKQAGARVVVVTNQSGVARGLITPAGLEAVHAKLRSLLAEEGASLDAIYFCPHHPQEDCACRKPKIAMVERAAAQLGLNPAGYYVVGDQRRDIELGHRIGARTLLVTTGPVSHEHLASLQAEGRAPDGAVASLREAVQWILDDVRHRQPSPAEGSALSPLPST